MKSCTMYRVCMILGAALALGPAAMARADLESGTAAPNFELASLDHAKTVALDKVEGFRLLVLVRAGGRMTSETLALCRRVTGRLEKPRRPWAPILVWAGPVPDRSEAASSPGATWRVLQDPEGRVAQAYQMIASPTIYWVDPKGEIMHVFSGWQDGLELRLLGILASTLEAEPLPSPGAAFGHDQRERAKLYFELGRAMADYGAWRKALGFFERGLAIDSDAVDALAESARSAYLSFDDDKAHTYARRALELDADHPLAKAVQANLEGRPTTLRWRAAASTR